MKNIIVVYGLPGAGKSTAAKILSEEFSGEIYTAYPVIKEQKELEYEDLITRVDLGLTQSDLIIVDGTFTGLFPEANLPNKILNKFLENAQKKGYGFLGIEVSCSSEEVQLNRLKNDSKDTYFKFKDHYDVNLPDKYRIQIDSNIPLGDFKESLISQVSRYLKLEKMEA